VCGATRNEVVCGCDAIRGEVLDERWKALHNLKVQ
jgi:hypothetical protein